MEGYAALLLIFSNNQMASDSKKAHCDVNMHYIHCCVNYLIVRIKKKNSSTVLFIRTSARAIADKTMEKVELNQE